jgi:uncharacterized coiled-coil protein SlyX
MKIFRLFVAFTLICSVLSPVAKAVSPFPDGGYLNLNTAEGDGALFSLTTGNGNTALGFKALNNNATGSNNTAIGKDALRQNRDDNNTAIGGSALFSCTTGYGNVAVGASALLNDTIGSLNIALGPGAGHKLTRGDRNIDIGNDGVAGESATIRIGTDVEQTRTFIAGIAGTGTPDGVAVLVSTDGKLGTRTSSARFKDEIKPMDKASEVLFALTPVAFRYKKDIDPAGIPQFGLVAEDVAKVNPDLVVRDKDGKPYTVRYDAVNAMLLNEFLKEHRKNQEQEATIALLKSTDAKQEAIISQLKVLDARQEATIAQQQKQIDALTAGLQKVSAQLEASKPAPQVVNNP